MSEAERININSADIETLATLPGIALALANRIVQYRENVHPFEEIIELAAVPGISERMVRSLEDQITVEGGISSIAAVSAAAVEEAAESVVTEATEAGEEAIEATESVVEEAEEQATEAVEVVAITSEEAADQAETAVADTAEEMAEATNEAEEAAEEVVEEVAESIEETEEAAEIDAPAIDADEMAAAIVAQAFNNSEATEEVEDAAEEAADTTEEMVEEIEEEVAEPIVVGAVPEPNIPVTAAAATSIASPVFEPAPSTSRTQQESAAVQESKREFHIGTMLLGGVLGALLALLALFFMNGWSLNFAGAGDVANLEQQLTGQSAILNEQASTIDSLNAQLNSLNNQVSEGMANTGTQLEAVNGSLSTLDDSLTGTQGDVSDLQAASTALMAADEAFAAADAEMTERLDVVASSAENADDFMTGMRDLLITIQGLPEGASMEEVEPEGAAGMIITPTTGITATETMTDTVLPVPAIEASDDITTTEEMTDTMPADTVDEESVAPEEDAASADESGEEAPADENAADESSEEAPADDPGASDESDGSDESSEEGADPTPVPVPTEES